MAARSCRRTASANAARSIPGRNPTPAYAGSRPSPGASRRIHASVLPNDEPRCRRAHSRVGCACRGTWPAGERSLTRIPAMGPQRCAKAAPTIASGPASMTSFSATAPSAGDLHQAQPLRAAVGVRVVGQRARADPVLRPPVVRAVGQAAERPRQPTALVEAVERVIGQRQRRADGLPDGRRTIHGRDPPQAGDGMEPLDPCRERVDRGGPVERADLQVVLAGLARLRGTAARRACARPSAPRRGSCSAPWPCA